MVGERNRLADAPRGHRRHQPAAAGPLRGPRGWGVGGLDRDDDPLGTGFAFTTDAGIGRIQESEVSGAAWYPLAVAGRVAGPRIARVVSAPPG